MKITVCKNQKESVFTEESSLRLSSFLQKHNLSHNMPCGGNGICGKCKVKAQGNLSPLSESEKTHLTAEELADGVRLSCKTEILGDCIIYPDYNTSADNMQGLLAGKMPYFEKDSSNGNFGVAIDIGTTTVAFYLWNIPEAKLIASECIANPQGKYGSDVISRILFDKDNQGLLTKEINSAISRVVSSFAYPIDKLVITGNTTMLSLYKGLDVQSLGVYPYTAPSLFGTESKNEILPPCISSFVGADITCAILLSRMGEQKEPALLIDIGTNGEIAYFDGTTYSCCATAAGPAFEGAGITYGMQAKKGAINKVWLKEGKICYSTIENGTPIGICGSGLMDAIAVLLEKDLIDETGYLEDQVEIGDSKIFITPDDVRAVQLAKSAIKSGIDTLLMGKAFPKSFYIAGGFGCYVDLNSCVKVGLFDKALLPIAKTIGNGAGLGASLILLSDSEKEKAKELVKHAEAQELAQNPIFMENYMNNMLFEKQ